MALAHFLDREVEVLTKQTQRAVHAYHASRTDLEIDFYVIFSRHLSGKRIHLLIYQLKLPSLPSWTLFETYTKLKNDI